MAMIFQSGFLEAPSESLGLNSRRRITKITSQQSYGKNMSYHHEE